MSPRAGACEGVKAQAQYNRRDNDRDRYEREREWRRERDRMERERQQNVYDRDGDGVDDRYEQNGGYYGRGGYGYNIAQIAADQGYRDGLNTGASDGQRGQNYDPQRSHYYRNANSGYSSSYGNRSVCQQYYRDGFVQGYREGYRQYGNGRYGSGCYGRNYPTSRADSILGSIFGRP